MTIERDFAEMMEEVAIFANQASIDKYGKQTFSASPTSYSARVMNSQRIVRDKDGREIVEAGKAIIYGVLPNTVTPLSKIVLPNGSTPPIIHVDTIQDENGDHHTSVTFGQ